MHDSGAGSPRTRTPRRRPTWTTTQARSNARVARSRPLRTRPRRPCRGPARWCRPRALWTAARATRPCSWAWMPRAGAWQVRTALGSHARWDDTRWTNPAWRGSDHGSSSVPDDLGTSPTSSRRTSIDASITSGADGTGSIIGDERPRGRVRWPRRRRLVWTRRAYNPSCARNVAPGGCGAIRSSTRRRSCRGRPPRALARRAATKALAASTRRTGHLSCRPAI